MTVTLIINFLHRHYNRFYTRNLSNIYYKPVESTKSSEKEAIKGVIAALYSYQPPQGVY